MRKGLVCLFLLMVLLQNPITGEAANWVKVGESASNSPKMTIYIDADSVQTTKTGSREAWTKGTYEPPRPTTDLLGQKVNSAYSLRFEVYTQDKYYCTQEIVEYYSNGTSGSNSYRCELRKIPPDTLGEAVWNYLFK